MLGLLLALAATSLVQSQLVGIGRFDPLTWAATILVLAAIAFIASYLPIRRASRQDAVLALRADGSG